MTAVHLPSADEFEAFKLFMFRLIDAALWVFMLMGVLFLGVKHIPRLRPHRRRERKI